MPAARRCLSEQAFVPISAAVFAVMTACMTLPAADAGILFADSFRYANGNLAGNSGGTGWAGAWTGGGAGGNLVTAPLVANPSDTTARSIRISSNASTTTRSLSTTYTTGGGSYYVSFVFNASPYSAPNSGEYAGITLYLSADRNNSLFLGMPGSSGQLGFDWTQRGDGLYAAASATNYLVLCAITTEAASTTTVRMYATTDLAMTGSALATPAMQIASLVNEPMFSFDSVEIAGGYNSGTINFAGLAMADNANDAVTFTQNAVPGPGAMLVAALAARWRSGPPAGAGSRRRRA
jgi:hypothetical protein